MGLHRVTTPIALVLVLAASTGVEAQDELPEVVVLEAERRDLEIEFVARGVGRPARSDVLRVPVTARVTGVSPVLEEGGGPVEAGAEILRLDGSAIEAELAAAGSMLEAREARLALLEKDLAELREGDSRLSSRDREARVRELRLRLAIEEGELGSARAALERLRRDADGLVLGSPVARSLILETERGPAEPPMVGELVEAGRVVGVLAPAPGSVEVEIRLPRGKAQRLMDLAGATSDRGLARALLEARPVGLAGGGRGRIVRVEGLFGPGDEAAAVLWIQPDDPALVEVDGEVDLRLPLGYPGAVLVPRAAVRAGGTVWLVGEGGVVLEREIAVETEAGELAVVGSGLVEGEVVVVEAPAGVSPGDRVRPVGR